MPENLYLSIKRIPNFRGIRCQKLACLSKNDIFKMFASCINEGSLKGIRDAAILAVGLGCGLRRSEIAELRITNIDFTSSLIRFWEKEIVKGILVLIQLCETIFYVGFESEDLTESPTALFP